MLAYCNLYITGHASVLPREEPLLTINQLSAEFARLIYKIGCILDESSNHLKDSAVF